MSVSNEVYRSLEQLPQFPAIATKVLRVMSHDDARIQEIAGLIRADASLAAQLLRVANSALYAHPSPIGSIEKALVTLGFDQVKKSVLAISTKSFFQSSLRLDLLRGIWRHSLACAIVSEELSRACSTSGGADDRAYTCALLHDIGRLGLFVAHPREYAELLSGLSTELDILEREREAFGLDHCAAGGWLAGNWGLPEEVRVAATGHHQPPNTAAFNLETLVQVAVLLADSLGFDVLPPARAYTVQQIRALLPHTAQYRFDPDPELFKARITSSLDAFD